MRGFSAGRRPPWLPGLVVLLVAAGLGLGAGAALDLEGWPAYLGLVLLVLLLMGGLERLFTGRKPSLPARAKSRLRLIRGGKSAIDLATDESHKDQKWLM
jgi:hypothetical protein